MKFSQLPGITDGKLIRLAQDQEVTSLLTDSRKAQVAEGGALFFAITGLHHDGHDFVASLYHQGMRQFIVERPLSGDYPDANVIQVTSSLRALQQMVEGHRRLFKIPVIGITGSNGKTIVKEWLYQLSPA